MPLKLVKERNRRSHYGNYAKDQIWFWRVWAVQRHAFYSDARRRVRMDEDFRRIDGHTADMDTQLFSSWENIF